MLYRQHRIPLLATYRQQTVRAHLEILERHIARDRVIDDLSQHDVDSYALARRSGTLESPHKPGQEPGVHDGTIRNELTTLMAVLNWGVVFRLGGRRLLAANPLRGAVIPREKNAKRPLATEERYQKLLEVADRAPSPKAGCGYCSRSRATRGGASTHWRTSARRTCCSRATRW
jgi:hypothetical protein